MTKNKILAHVHQHENLIGPVRMAMYHYFTI